VVGNGSHSDRGGRYEDIITQIRIYTFMNRKYVVGKRQFVGGRGDWFGLVWFGDGLEMITVSFPIIEEKYCFGLLKDLAAFCEI
jgi:hypothetical protein